MKKPSVRKYDLVKLEDEALLALSNWGKEDGEETRTQLFQTIQELAYAVLKVGGYDKHNIDYSTVAYEYALYLFERLILKSFCPVAKTRFPLQHYIRKNIKNIVFSTRNKTNWRELVSDLEFLIEDTSLRTTADYCVEDSSYNYYRKEYAGRLLKALRIFYSEKDITRMMPLCIDFLYENSRHLISKKAPKDIQDFTIVMISLAKRIAHNHSVDAFGDCSKGELKKVLSSATRSTVFLSSIVNVDFFPKSLLLACDVDSLFRLVSIHGGQTIRIPTMRELDTLLGAVVTVSKAIMENKDISKTLNETKDKLDLVFSNHINVEVFIQKIFSSYNMFKEDSNSEPLVNILCLGIRSLEKLLNRLGEGDTTQTQMLSQYTELSNSMNQFLQSFASVNRVSG